jgi:hypothetical protein
VARFLAIIYEHIGPTSLPIYLSMALQSFVVSWPLFRFLNPTHICSDSLDADQPVARPLPTHRTTQTQQTRRIHIHVLSGIWTHHPSVRASEDCSCLGLRGHCDRHKLTYIWFILSLFLSRYPLWNLIWVLLFSLVLQLFTAWPNPARRNLPNYLGVVTELKSFAIVNGLIECVPHILMWISWTDL